MAITEEVITKYLADVSDFNAKFTEMENRLKGVEGKAAATGQTTKQAFQGAGKEADNLSGKLSGGLSSAITKIGGLLVAAFSVQQIIAFGNTAVTEFAKAEKAALQLLGALNGNEVAQKRLLNLAKEFQQRFGIDNDIIVAQESFLAVQQRTETQIKKTIQAAIQLTAAIGGTLEENVRKLDATFEGNIGKLGKLDSRFGDLTKQQLANGAAIDIVNEKYAGFAEKGLSGVAGELQRIEVESDEATKKLGQAFAPIKIFFTDAKKDIINFFADILEGVKSFTSGSKKGGEEIQKFRAEQLSVSLKAFESFSEEKLKRLQAADERELANSKNLTEKQKALIESEIDAIKQLLILREQDAESAKKAAQPSVEDLKKAADAKAKAEKEAADKIAEINEDNFKLAEDNLKKFQAEQISLIEGQNISREEKEKAFAQLELNVLNARRQNYIDYGKDIGDIDIQIANKHIELNKAKEKSDKDFFDKIEKQRKDSLKDAIEAEDRRLKAEEEAAEKRKKLTQDVFDLSQELLQTFGEAFDSSDAAELDRIEDRKDARIDAIDQQIEALEDANKRGKLSDKDLEKQKKVLLEQRAAAEKKALEEQNAIKRKEAEREKLLSLFRIGLILAEAIAEVNAFKIIAATAQLVAVAATPIPEFWKGKKEKTKSGLGYVGERGKELMYIPGQAKIVPAHQTEKHKGLIDAMIDNNLEKYVFQHYIAPALMEASKKSEKLQSKSFAENIASSFRLNGGMDEYGMIRALGSNNKKAAEAIGKVIAKNLNNGYKNPYYR